MFTYKDDEYEIDLFGETSMFTETEIGNIALTNSDMYTVASGLVHDGTDYRALSWILLLFR